MDVVQGVKDGDSDAEGAVLRDSAFGHNLAQQAALAPLHDHVNAGAILSAIDAHHLGVEKLFADGGLALKAVKEDGIGFHVGMGNLEGNHAVVAYVHGAEDGRHTAAGNGRFNAIEVDLRAVFDAVEKTARRSTSTA